MTPDLFVQRRASVQLHRLFPKINSRKSSNKSLTIHPDKKCNILYFFPNVMVD